MRSIFIIIIAALLYSATMPSFAQINELAEESHSGSNCEAANQSQASLMTWSKEGITNNAPIDLYVICPGDINPTMWRRMGNGVSTVFAFVYMKLPAGYGPTGSAGPFCILRLTSSGVGTSAPHIPINVQGIIPISAYFPTTPGGISREIGYLTLKLNPVAAIGGGADLSTHLLCTLPKNGGTISSYNIGTAVSGRT